jgi:hypothetical protein
MAISIVALSMPSVVKVDGIDGGASTFWGTLHYLYSPALK